MEWAHLKPEGNVVSQILMKVLVKVLVKVLHVSRELGAAASSREGVSEETLLAETLALIAVAYGAWPIDLVG
jgi:hypothetical protein